MAIKIFIAIVSFFCVQSLHYNFLYGQEVNNPQHSKQATSIPIDTLQVSVDNHKLSMYVSGKGKHTVILEAGGSSNHRCWRTIDTQIAKLTRVISYDRPGYLKSEMCEKTRDAVIVAKELKQALQTAGYPPPYILVGWSMGGAFARVFCGLFPESVVGLVLVDPTPEDVYDRLGKEFPELMVEDSMAYAKELLASKNRPGEFAENTVFDSSMNQARGSDALHSTPTNLLIARYGKAPDKFENDPTHPINRLWVEELEKWAAKRPNLQYKVIECGHHITKVKPEIVMKAISEMIEQIK
jgi:pimeloyl-ACP methyl ester carboxylesterase